MTKLKMTSSCAACLGLLKNSQELLHPKCYRDLFGARKVKLKLRYFHSEIVEEVRRRAVRMSLGGAQPKASLALLKGQLEIVTLGGEYLLKPSTERHPFISENEHLCMNIARLCDLPVPPFCLVTLQGGELAFLIKRFDRKRAEKIQIEDLGSVLNLPAVAKYDGTYLEAGRAVERHVRDKGLEKLLFLKQVMLSYLMGNNDLHLKNFSLIDCGGYYRLSPVYDLVCSARYYDQTDLALALAPEFLGHLKTVGFYTADDFVDLGRMLEIGHEPLRRLVKALIALQGSILQLVEASFLPEKEKVLVTEIMREQFRKFGSK
jgi:serine/threonine-protein kinase HipA